MLYVACLDKDCVRSAEVLSNIPEDETDISILRTMDTYDNNWETAEVHPFLCTVEAPNAYIARGIVANEQSVDPRMLNLAQITPPVPRLWRVDLVFEVTKIERDMKTGQRENVQVSGIVMADNSEDARSAAKSYYTMPDTDTQIYTLTRTKVTFLKPGPVDSSTPINFILT